MMNAQPFLRLESVSKHYGGVCALQDVSLDVDFGEAHCLIGENGSGKSTLIKIISGAAQPDPGAAIEIKGDRYASLAPSSSVAAGVQVIYQDHALFPHLSVAENVCFGLPRTRGIVSRRRQRKTTEEIISRLGIDLDPRLIVGDLPVSMRQLVAIARAMAAGGQLLIMDEPTASLAAREVDALFRIVEDLKCKGASLLFVSHRLNEVRRLAERVTVLRDGHKTGTYPAADVTDDRLTTLMTGQRFEATVRPTPPQKPERFRVDRLSRPGEFHDISFFVQEGEVLGIIGPLGAGRTELALTIFGLSQPFEGEMTLDGAPFRPRSNREALAHGVSYLPEDRLTLGLVLPQPIRRNMILSVLQRFAGPGGVLRRGALDALVNRLISDLRIKVSDVDAAVGTLSGGNQQRVALARVSATGPRVLILDCPTVGVDIGAKHAIYQIVHNLAEEGLAVILITDEESEALQQCHRILTMRDGRITGEFHPALTDPIQLAEYAHG